MPSFEPVSLTRDLVNIESTTELEFEVGLKLTELLSDLAQRFDGTVERWEVEPNRFNVYACFGSEPVVTLSTHMDTVPPFIACTEDDVRLYGRGTCDAKGLAAAMICAAERLLEAGRRGIALLFVVGEERNSAGARWAAQHPRGSKYLINGEPTENRLAIGSKGALRYELIAHGKMAHSAYPHLGESAILKLLDALQKVREVRMPVDELLGQGSMNIGTIRGGRAHNVIPDEARAEVLIRLVSDHQPVCDAIEAACEGLVECNRVLLIPAARLGAEHGFDTMVAAFTTDIPAFNGAWGVPYLIGPGSILVAHTDHEFIDKDELREGVAAYERLASILLDRAAQEHVQ